MSTAFKLDKWGIAYPVDLDKTTVDGYAEALLIAMRLCRDLNGNLVLIGFGTPAEDIFITRQIAELMLRKEPSGDQ